MGTEDSLREFLEKISTLKPLEYKAHPSDRILIDHLSGKLSKDWRFSDRRLENLLRGELADWTHTDVSAHVLTCVRCTRRVASLKSPVFRIVLQAGESLRAIAQRMKRPALRPLLQRRAIFYGHLAAYAVASLLIVLSLYQLPPFSSSAAGPPPRFEAPEGVGLQPHQKEKKEEPRKGIERLTEKEMAVAPKQELPAAYTLQWRRPSFSWGLLPVILWGVLVILHGVTAFKKRQA